ncbi:MAG: hypothetical protein KGM47_00140 [Acidobacteriota bacterium]|nr:hypothetical protein [Acidobacteriota bacterium]
MSNSPQHDDRMFELLAEQQDEAGERSAPSRLKSRLYSALVRRQEESGPLRSLRETRAAGHGLCVFEAVWQRAISRDAAQCFNCCKLCHARVLGEHVEGAPIYWGNCPYVAFGKK